jgi:hypothetical protein
MRRLQQIITGESAMAELLRRRQREVALEQRIKKTLPRSLAACVAVSDARSSELTLSATSGAAAALLRQRAPDLLRTLADEGCEFTGIRVRVQARHAPRHVANTLKKQLDAHVATKLLATAVQLGDSPLASALRRLAAHVGETASERASERDESPAQRVEDENRKE